MGGRRGLVFFGMYFVLCVESLSFCMLCLEVQGVNLGVVFCCFSGMFFLVLFGRFCLQ